MQDVTDSVSGASPLTVAAFCRSDLVMDILLNVDFWIAAFRTTQYQSVHSLLLSNKGWIPSSHVRSNTTHCHKSLQEWGQLQPSRMANT